MQGCQGGALRRALIGGCFFQVQKGESGKGNYAKSKSVPHPDPSSCLFSRQVLGRRGEGRGLGVLRSCSEHADRPWRTSAKLRIGCLSMVSALTRGISFLKGPTSTSPVFRALLLDFSSRHPRVFLVLHRLPPPAPRWLAGLAPPPLLRSCCPLALRFCPLVPLQTNRLHKDHTASVILGL